MTVAQKTTTKSLDEQLADDPDRLTDIARRSFASAKRKAIAENERLGITSYGTVDRRIVARGPKAPGT